MSKMFYGCMSLLKFNFNEVFKNVQFPFTVVFSEFLRESGITSFSMNNVKLNLYDSVAFRQIFMDCNNLSTIRITNCSISGVDSEGESGYDSWIKECTNIKTIDLTNTEFISCCLISFLDPFVDSDVECLLKLTGTKFINCNLTDAFIDLNIETIDFTATIFQDCKASSLFYNNNYLKNIYIERTFSGITDGVTCFSANNLQMVKISNTSVSPNILSLFYNASVNTIKLTNCKNISAQNWFQGIKVNTLTLTNCSFVSLSLAFIGIICDTIDLSSCDLSNCKNMDSAFVNATVKTIKMKGAIPNDVNVFSMFAGAFASNSKTGTFYYDKNYDYSKIIEQLPEGWAAVAE